ncbi:MAG: hypothetical protein GC154_19465 [bacterium]|nr:hypothetical protein [bacterium]
MMQNNSCREWEERLSAYSDGELMDSPALEAHVEECPLCRRRLANHQALGERLRQLPPPDLSDCQNRLEMGILQKRHFHQGNRSILAAASVVILLLVGVWVALRPASHDSMLRDYFDDHIGIVATQDHKGFLSDDPKAMEAWLSERLGFIPNIPPWPWAQWKSARLCAIRGERVAFVQLAMNDLDASLFIHPSVRHGMSETASPQSPHIAVERGYAAACWQKDGLEYVLVAPASATNMFNRLD